MDTGVQELHQNRALGLASPLATYQSKGTIFSFGDVGPKRSLHPMPSKVPLRGYSSITLKGHVLDHQKYPAFLQLRLQVITGETDFGAGSVSLRIYPRYGKDKRHTRQKVSMFQRLFSSLEKARKLPERETARERL